MSWPMDKATLRELLTTGRLDELRALADDPHVEAVLHLAEGRAREAVACARAAGEEARNTLAVALLTCGERAEAEAILTELVSQASDSADLWFNLARSSRRLEHVRRSLSLRPGWVDALVLEARLIAEEGRVEQAVLLTLELGPPGEPLLRELLSKGRLPRDRRILPHLPLAVLPGACRMWPEDEELLLRCLRDGLLTDLELERDLTRRRRERDLSPALAEALAAYGMTNEFAFLEDPGEVPPPDDPWHALYRHVDAHPWPLVQERHVGEPACELELVAQLHPERAQPEPPPDPVARQYSQNPYPRWRELDFLGPPLPFPTVVNHPDAPRGPLRVLVAGCGTGRHALIAASRYADSKVWGVDVSAPSLAYAARQAERLGVENVEFRLGDLRALPPEVPEQFEVIECVGVLHHLEDPLQGLLALRRRLAPGGWLRLGLYSRAARAGLDPARRLARSMKGAPLRDIRARLIRELAPQDLEFLAGFADFYSLSGLRDLLLHEREMECDLPQIAAWLEAADLTPVGPIADDPRSMYDFWTKA